MTTKYKRTRMYTTPAQDALLLGIVIIPVIVVFTLCVYIACLLA